jgi:hypothetical protein
MQNDITSDSSADMTNGIVHLKNYVIPENVYGGSLTYTVTWEYLGC